MRSLFLAGSLAIVASGIACTGPDRLFVDAVGGGGPGVGGGGGATSTSASTSTGGGGVGGVGGGGGSGGQASALAIDAPPEQVVLRDGGSVVVEVAVTRTGPGSQPTVITVGDLPAGVTADPLEVPAEATTAELTLRAAPGALQGPATLVVTGTAGGLDDDATIDLIVAGASGTPDETFVDDTGRSVIQVGGLGTRGRGLLIQPDGKIVVAGISTVNQGQFVAVRLDALGAKDPGFGVDGVVGVGVGGGSGAMTVAIETSGRLLLGGFGNVDFDYNCALAILALEPDGDIDGTFGVGGSVTSPYAGSGCGSTRVILPASTGLAAIGTFTNAVNAVSTKLYGYDLAGTLTSNHQHADEIVQVAARQADGKLLFGGRAFDTFYLRRSLDVTTPDPAFSGGFTYVNFTNRRATATGLAVFPGGQILLGGVSTDTSNTDPRVAFAKLNSNGSIDASFGTGGTVVSSVPMRSDAAGGMVVDSQGRMLFGGFVGEAARQPAVARFLPDGTPDVTFGPDGTGYVVLDFPPESGSWSVGVWGIAVDALDRVVVSGEVGPSGTASLFVARYWF